MHWWVYAIAFVFGYGVIYFTLKDTVAKRMLKYLGREIGHKIPTATSFTVESGQIRCSCLGSQIIFNVDDLTAITEDPHRIELNFGEVGLCTIPLRAFGDSADKAHFLENIRREQARHGDAEEAV
jgi:hypothetical protein